METVLMQAFLVLSGVTIGVIVLLGRGKGGGR